MRSQTAAASPAASVRHVRDLLGFLAGTRGRRELPSLAGAGLAAVDVQRIFVNPASPAYVRGWRAAAPNMAALLSAFTFAGRPVVCTRHVQHEGEPGGTFGHFFARPLRPEDELSQLDESALRFVPPAVVTTKALHAAFAAGLPPALAGCRVVVLAGVQTPLCIVATAIDLARAGVVPVVAADACAARDLATHRAALRTLAAGHAHVATTAEVLRALAGEGSP